MHMDGEAGVKIPIYPILILSILLLYGILPLWAVIALSGWYLLLLYLEENVGLILGKKPHLDLENLQVL